MEKLSNIFLETQSRTSSASRFFTKSSNCVLANGIMGIDKEAGIFLETTVSTAELIVFKLLTLAMSDKSSPKIRKKALSS